MPEQHLITILHVDDNDANRYVHTRMLQKAGFEVVEAATGTEALHLLEEIKPDLIVLDVKLPDIHGFEVCRKIKANPATASIPVLHLSASFINSEDKAQGLDSGADGYLSQPVDQVELIATAKALLRIRQAEAERAELLRREQAAREQAEAASRMKDEFLAIVSHELRSPLNAMLGWARLLRTRKFDEATRDRALETIERNAALQKQLIEDLLDISSIIRGKLRLNIRPVQLVNPIEAAIDTVRLAAEAKAIRIESVLDPTTGAVSGDSDRLQQVVWNLLSNAIKFTPSGGCVKVRLDELDSYAQFQVSDTGCGIDVEFLPYVFDRFRQADGSMTRSYTGLGLGLAIVRQLVELHGGTVQAESLGEGQGATFTVKLPLLKGSREQGVGSRGEESYAPLPLYTSAPLPMLDGLRVLVVDDEADTRQFISTVLEECNAGVTTAASVAQAMEAIAQVKPDVVVSDIGMPDEDGYALISKLRALEAEQGWRIPAVALTAYARLEDRQRALSAGFQMHVAKPIEPAELAAVVAKLAGRTTTHLSA